MIGVVDTVNIGTLFAATACFATHIIIIPIARWIHETDINLIKVNFWPSMQIQGGCERKPLMHG